jgi:uncharacterized membrane protein (UPF0127 family)
VYAKNKKGKTRFCTTAPDVLILDPEDGTAREKRRDPDTWPVDTWEDLVDAAGFLKSRSNKSPITGKPYRWCAWDGATRIGQIAVNFIRSQEAIRDLSRKPSDIKIQDYGRANKMIEEAVHQFHALRDIGLIFTAQERMVEIANMEDLADDTEATPAGYMYVADLSKGARTPFNQVCDVIGRLYVVRGEFTRTRNVRRGGVVQAVEVPSTTERRLFVGVHDMYDTGCRTDYDLPDYFANPTVPALVSAMREGVK